MSTIRVEPIEGAAFEAWRDGKPSLPAEDAARAASWIGEPVGLTPEGPYYAAAWDTLEAAAAFLTELYPQALVVADPSIAHLIDQDGGM
jgi:hypothetical protein